MKAAGPNFPQVRPSLLASPVKPTGIALAFTLPEPVVTVNPAPTPNPLIIIPPNPTLSVLVPRTTSVPFGLSEISVPDSLIAAPGASV